MSFELNVCFLSQSLDKVESLEADLIGLWDPVIMEIDGRNSLYRTVNGFLLDCLAYRAWAPGHPRKGFKCAALSDKGLWVSYECKKRLPFLCELKQSGPLSPCINLPSEWRQECRKTFIRSFPTPKRNPRCGDPQIDENTFRLPLLQTNNITTTNQTTTEKQNVTQLKPQRKLPN